MVWLPAEDEVRIWSPGYKHKAQIKVQLPLLLQPSLPSPLSTFMSCSRAPSLICSHRHHACDRTDHDTQVAALVPEGQWMGDCRALPDPTFPFLEKAVVPCQQQPSIPTLVPFSLSSGGVRGPQGDVDLSCSREIIGKWHVQWEPILAPSRDRRTIYTGKKDH